MSTQILYVFGNGNLSVDDFLTLYVPGLQRAIDAQAEFWVGDFRGVDTLTLEWLKTKTAAVTVVHVGERPRYLPDRYHTKVSGWTIQGGFDSDATRDQAGIDACTAFLAHDFNTNARRTSGTRRNIDACLALDKPAWV